MKEKERIEFIKKAQTQALLEIEEARARLEPFAAEALKQAERIKESFALPAVMNAVNRASELGEYLMSTIDSINSSIPLSTYNLIPSKPPISSEIWRERHVEEIIRHPRMAIEEIEGEIYFYGKNANFINKNGLEYLLLIALLRYSDEKGFCSYEKIYEFFLSKGKKRILLKEKREKQIHNVKSQLLRRKVRKNIQMPVKTHEELKIIDVIPGEGLIFRNFEY